MWGRSRQAQRNDNSNGFITNGQKLCKLEVDAKLKTVNKNSELND